MSDRYYVTDTSLSERFPIYTRANVGEVFPDPVTPLTSDTALYLAELGWRDAWERIGAFDTRRVPARRATANSACSVAIATSMRR